MNDKGKPGYVWKLVWLLPVVMLIGLEFTARHTIPLNGMWFENVRFAAQRHDIDYLLLGTSRTAAAIDPIIASQLLSTHRNDTMYVTSLAGGYLSLQLSVLATQALIRDFPNQTHGLTVVMEMPDGLPPITGSWSELPAGWDGSWVQSDSQPERLARILTVADLRAFWRSETDLELKLLVSGRFMLKGSTLINAQEMLRGRLLNYGERAVRKALKLVGAKPDMEADLDTAGGIRTDADEIERVRAAFRSWKVADWKALTELDWDHSLLGELAHRVNAHGGCLVGYYAPHSSYDAEMLEHPLAAAAIQRFHVWAMQRGILILNTGLNYADSEFPDGLHLARRHRELFTNVLSGQLARTAACTG